MRITSEVPTKKSGKVKKSHRRKMARMAVAFHAWVDGEFDEESEWGADSDDSTEEFVHDALRGLAMAFYPGDSDPHAKFLADLWDYLHRPSSARPVRNTYEKLIDELIGEEAQ